MVFIQKEPNFLKSGCTMDLPYVRKLTGLAIISFSFCCRSPSALTYGQPLDSIENQCEFKLQSRVCRAGETSLRLKVLLPVPLHTFLNFTITSRIKWLFFRRFFSKATLI